MVALRFDRGTLVATGRGASGLPGFAWDERSSSWRTTAHRLGPTVSRIVERGIVLEEDPRARWTREPSDIDELALRPYQHDALRAWHRAKRRGLVVLPTGAGKTRVAIAALREVGLPSAVLCPTRALAWDWKGQLEAWTRGPVGIVADGKNVVERTTVMTFESAYRWMDRIGDRFGLLVVDEAHHFGGGVRCEALEACAATVRLGLTATAPPAGGDELARLGDLVGPVVFELGFGDLVGTHLAPMQLVRTSVALSAEEKTRYERDVGPFTAMRRAFFRTHRGADYPAFVRSMNETKEGRLALVAHAAAQELASFPVAKRELTRNLLLRHRADKTIVFTAYAENAYVVAVDNLIPVIAAETKREERERILARFREGRIRAIASARVLNEGIDVPDANVAIIVAGMLGAREHVQRIGRVLRPAPGKVATVYELVTGDTMDERKAFARGGHAPGKADHMDSGRTEYARAGMADRT